MQALFPIEHVTLPSLPAASAYPNSVVVVAGVPFFSNGTTWTDLTRGRPPFENVTTALAIVSNSVAINLALGDYFTLTVSANITSMTLINPPAAGVVRRIFIRVTRDSNGARTFTLPAGWTPAPHSAPGILTDFVQGANKVTDIEAWTLNGTDWTYFIEPRNTGTGTLSNGYVPRFTNATDLTNSLLWGNSTAIGIGTTTVPTESRLYVYGGASGAHVDVRGEPTVADQAILDLQGSDFDTEFRSLFLRYSGPNSVGTIAGLPAQNFAEITSVGDNFVIRNLLNAPIRFMVEGVEVFQVTKTGIVSTLNVTAPNVGGGGGGGLGGTVTLDVSAGFPQGALQHAQTFSAAGITAASRLDVRLAGTADTAENDPEMLAVSSLWAVPGADELTIGITFAMPVSGPVVVNWSAP